MSMRREAGVQDELVATWAEIPRSPGHAFYDRLQTLLKEAGFDVFVEDICKPYYAPRMGAPSLPPGRYFRLHMVGYFEGIDSERGIVWRCSDSLSLREFLRLASRDKVPDHSWLSKTRSRLPHEVHEKVFAFILQLVADRGLVKGERIGVDGSTMEANAALRTIVGRDSGKSYREMLTRMAEESGVATPTIEDLARLDRKRKGKKLSNQDWTSPTDPDAKIARMKDGTTHLAYKPEHAVRISTPASSLRRRSTPPTRAIPRRWRRRWRRPRRTFRPWALLRHRKSPAISSPTRAITHARWRRISTMVPGRRVPPNRCRARAICAGTATRRPGLRSIETAIGCDRASARTLCASAERSSNAVSLTPWNGVACAGHGCGATKTSTSAISSMSPATISAS